MDNIEIGRILRASTLGFAIGCRVNQLQHPAFGSLVKATPVTAVDGREVIYGLIYDMHIDDDPLVRRLVLTEKSTAEIIRDQRDNRMLPLEMSVLAVGYQQHDAIRHGLPPRPPLSLDPVTLCRDRDEIIRFSDSLGYLRLILRATDGSVPVDQLLVAHITDMYQLRGNDRAWAMAAIEQLIDLLRANYEMLIPAIEALSETLEL